MTLIGCLLLAYAVKKSKIYYLPESAGALIVGMVLGGMARAFTDRLELFTFSPEVFFFVLLPPIIFEAGYSLNWNSFIDNIGAITLYAILGTIISTFAVGGFTFLAARVGLIRDIDGENPMEALLFGALISAVDPVATLSILGNDDLNCDPLLYSLVFGESVLNDAVAISLFKVFVKYYDPSGPKWSESEIPNALLAFLIVSILSICIGVGLGLVTSFLFKHTDLSRYPKLETSLLFCFCYLCYATAESLELSGIMALFFNGVVLSHYNSYNLSSSAQMASEYIFTTLATVSETIVFLFMGMGVFTGGFKHYDVLFSLLALILCLIGRVANIFPLSWVANCCRSPQNRISMQMQFVLWFAGLRGAIAFALAMNMPGPNKEVYTTVTLSICIFTTVVCGGLTDGVLTKFGMKQETPPGTVINGGHKDDDGRAMRSLVYSPNRNRTHSKTQFPMAQGARRLAMLGVKRLWAQFDEDVLKVYFGGHQTTTRMSNSQNEDTGDHNYELAARNDVSEYEDDEERNHFVS